MGGGGRGEGEGRKWEGGKVGEWKGKVCGHGEESIGRNGGAEEGYGMRVKVGSDRFSGISMALGVAIPCIHIGSVNFNVRIALILIFQQRALILHDKLYPKKPHPRI